MDITIKLFETTGIGGIVEYGAEIFIKGQWFKEIGGLPDVPSVLMAVSTNEDFIQEIIQ